jgi:hypothetical protein
MFLFESHASSDKHKLGSLDKCQFNGFNMYHAFDMGRAQKTDDPLAELTGQSDFRKCSEAVADNDKTKGSTGNELEYRGIFRSRWGLCRRAAHLV